MKNRGKYLQPWAKWALACLFAACVGVWLYLVT